MSNLCINKPKYNIFRSDSSRRLFAVHLTDNKENSLDILKDRMTFEEAQECMLQYEQLTQDGVVEVETEVIAD